MVSQRGGQGVGERKMATEKICPNTEMNISLPWWILLKHLYTGSFSHSKRLNVYSVREASTLNPYRYSTLRHAGRGMIASEFYGILFCKCNKKDCGILRFNCFWSSFFLFSKSLQSGIGRVFFST